MEKKYSIVIDTLGSDLGPVEILKGCHLVLDEFQNANIVVVGDSKTIKEELEKYQADMSRVEIIDAQDTITNLDKPMEAIFTKPHASILEALKYAGTHEEVAGVISAGNSGGILCGCVRYMLREDKQHPCMASILPHSKGSYTCVVDTGATIDCSSTQLVSFAHLGNDLMKQVYGIASPRIGLLSNGAEPTKGNKLVKETFPLLANDPTLNFVGNIEGNKTLAGDCDVLVCDGFAGNQVLKNSEGMAMNLIKEIVKYGKHFGKEEASMEIVNHLMKTYDFSSLGAALVLGAKKLVLKCRGNSNAQAIRCAAHILANIATNKTVYDGEEDGRNY